MWNIFSLKMGVRRSLPTKFRSGAVPDPTGRLFYHW
jgi:hypothetical protein